MQEHAAVFRDGPTLQAGVKKMNDLYKDLSDLKVIDYYFVLRIYTNEPAHEIMVLVTYATSEGQASLCICAVLPEPLLLAHKVWT